MFKLYIKESASRFHEWECLCEYLEPEQAFKDYLSLVENPKNYEYVALEKDGVFIAVFAIDDYYGVV